MKTVILNLKLRQMKAKHLMGAFALPVVFTACTADEIVAPEVSTPSVTEDLTLRPVVGKVSIGFDNVSSRAVNEGTDFNSIQFVEGDKLGVCLVDVAAELTKVNPIERYNLLTDSYNTNYVFKMVGDKFLSEAELVEGNYVYYYPYNDQKTRGAVWTNLPETQTVAVNSNGEYSTLASVLEYSEEKGAPLAIAYDFLSADESSLQLKAKLSQIYSMPLVTVRNNYTVTTEVGEDDDIVNVPTAITVKKVKLSVDGGFVVSAPLRFATDQRTAIAEVGYNNKSIVSALINETVGTTNYTGWWTTTSIDKTKGRFTSDMINVDATNVVKANEIVVEFEEAIEVPANGEFKFYALVPAADYTTSKLNVTIVTDDEKTSNTSVCKAATLYQGKRYPTEEYNADGTVNKDAAGSTLVAKVTELNAQDTPVVTPDGVTVNSEDALIDAIKTGEGAVNKILTLNLEGDAKITNRVIDYLNIVSTDLTKVIFKNGEIATTTPATLTPSVNVTFKNVTIAEGTEVTLNSSKVTVDHNGVVTNNGNLVLDAYLGNNINITNNGTLKVTPTNEKAITDFSIDNNGTLIATTNNKATSIKNNVDGVIEVSEDAKLTASVTNEGTINVAEGNTLTLSGALINKGSIVNEGTINAGAYLTNNANGIIVNGSKDNYLAKLDAAMEGSVNIGTIENWAILNVYNNSGTIEMKTLNSNATIYAGAGIVENNVLGNVALDKQGGSNTNKVTYTLEGSVTNIPEYLASSSINTLVLKDVSLTMNADINLTDLDVEISGRTIFSGTKGSGSSATTLKFTKAKTLTINEGSILTINASVNLNSIEGPENNFKIANYGTVNNFGKITNATITNDGTWEGDEVTGS